MHSRAEQPALSDLPAKNSRLCPTRGKVYHLAGSLLVQRQQQ